MSDNNSINRNKRLAFILSGAMDILIGGVILLIGFGLIPFDITAYGFERWHAILIGGVLFIVGVVVGSYNLSRLNE
jgi:ABC-type branched-subunit amino acid transport system permease subunit